MTDKDACALLWRNWTAGGVIAALPEDARPATRAEGYAIQAHFEAVSGQPRAGWKIAATSEAGQRHINVDGPIAGRLLADRLYEAGADVSLAGDRMLVAEPEFAFRFARDLPPRAEAYAEDEVMAAVGDMHLSLELPDSRFADFTAVGGAPLIADNACARDLVVGPAVTADWRALDLAAHPVHARVGARYERDGIGAAVLGGPRIALTWLVNELSRLGIGAKAGELVTTGTCMIPLEIQPGDVIEADYGALGRIGMRLVD